MNQMEKTMEDEEKERMERILRKSMKSVQEDIRYGARCIDILSDHDT